ncbi:ABC transporter permease [Streptomyces sp. HNM0575]|uniref:ABC transporter permease n=1 Tax=Streptomyces sp. HNM0575 TaxID=2716338 RepID=UPI00145DBF6D|nr:ABC transporter permease [Streptomyces sp. HNM0575]NLU75582.1 ABC transporter permease [Streptomyces sp. HNM0575]
MAELVLRGSLSGFLGGFLKRSRTVAIAGMLLRRVALLVVLLALSFLAVDAMPGDAARSTLDPGASDAEVAARRGRLELGEPVAVRFWHWLTGLVHGDLGVTARGRPAGEVIGHAFPDTLLLGLLALVLTLIVALALGCASVLRPGGTLDRAVSSASTVLLALPQFVVATALIVVFALWLPVLPAVSTTAGHGLSASPQTLVLPVLALTLPQIGWNTRIVRAALTDQLDAPHVDAALLDGLPRRRVLLHYVLPGALPTVAGGAATSVGTLLGGAIAIEVIFNIPGMGSVLTEAVHDRDATLVAGVVAPTALTITVVLVLADLLRAFAVGRNR